MKSSRGNVAKRKPRSVPRDSRRAKGIAVAMASVLEQLYQWRPGRRRISDTNRVTVPFDVRAAFDALDKN